MWIAANLVAYVCAMYIAAISLDWIPVAPFLFQTGLIVAFTILLPYELHALFNSLPLDWTTLAGYRVDCMAPLEIYRPVKARELRMYVTTSPKSCWTSANH